MWISGRGRRRLEVVREGNVTEVVREGNVTEVAREGGAMKGDVAVVKGDEAVKGDVVKEDEEAMDDVVKGDVKEGEEEMGTDLAETTRRPSNERNDFVRRN